MSPFITHQGVSYYDSPVESDYHFSIAMKLASLSSPQPYSNLELREFIGDMQAVTEAWLLWSRTPMLTQARKHKQGWTSMVFHALLLLHAFYDPDPDDLPNPTAPCSGIKGSEAPEDPESLVVAVEALCSDPWADQALLAAWADKRLHSLSAALGGAYELRVAVPERNTPLLGGFKKLGYFCFDYDPDPYHFGKEKRIDEGFGDLYFGKLLRVRHRKTQGKAYLFPAKQKKS